MLGKKFDLMSIPDTEQYVITALNNIKAFTGVPESDLPLCTPEELWQNPSKWAFYGKVENKVATRVLTTSAEAYDMQLAKGGTSYVQERKQRPTFCLYCDARAVCMQAAQYDAEGLFDAK